MKKNKELGNILAFSGLAFALITIILAHMFNGLLHNQTAAVICTISAIGGLGVFLAGIIIDTFKS